jgi:hypothetical protein
MSIVLEHGAGVDGGDRALHVGVGGDEHAGDVRPALLHVGEQLDAGLAGHAVVAEHNGNPRVLRLEQRHRLFDARGRQHGERGAERLLEVLDRLLLVVDVEHREPRQRRRRRRRRVRRLRVGVTGRRGAHTVTFE